MYQDLLFTEQTLQNGEVEVEYLKHINNIISNISIMSKRQIYVELLDLKDLITRYSDIEK